MAPFTPVMMDPTEITHPVPMITPRIVSRLRSLCSRIVASAIPAADRISRSLTRVYPSFVSASFLGPQSFNWIELRGALRRIDAEEQTNHGGEAYAQKDGCRRQLHGHGSRLAHRHGDGPR